MVSTFFIFQTLTIKSDRIFSLEDYDIGMLRYKDYKNKLCGKNFVRNILIILHRSVMKSYMVGIFE